MKQLLITTTFFVLAFAPYGQADPALSQKSLNENIETITPKENEVLLAWEHFPSWNKWLERPSSEYLVGFEDADENIKLTDEELESRLEVVEGRAVVLVPRSVDEFTADKMLNAASIGKLVPLFHHEVPALKEGETSEDPHQFRIQSSLKVTGTDFELKATSQFVHLDQTKIESSEPLKSMLLELSRRTDLPRVLLSQNSTRFNRLFDDMTTLMSFYPVNKKQTLVVLHFAILIQKQALEAKQGRYRLLLFPDTDAFGWLNTLISLSRATGATGSLIKAGEAAQRALNPSGSAENDSGLNKGIEALAQNGLPGFIERFALDWAKGLGEI